MRNFSHFLTIPSTEFACVKSAMLEKLVKLINLLISETLFNQHTIIKRAFTYLHTFTEHLLYSQQNVRHYNLRDTVSTLWSSQPRES